MNWGIPIDHFAYPFGLYNQSTQQLVREAGYKLAFSVRSGFNTITTDLFAIRRLEICGTDHILNFWIKLTFGVSKASLMVPIKYYYQRARERLGNKLPQGRR